MILEEMLRLFIDSRKRGVCGARQRCRPKSISVYENNLKVFFGFLQTGLGKDVVITRYENIRRMHILQFLDWMEGTGQDWPLESGDCASTSAYTQGILQVGGPR
jgi:hypothetical protein